jgi:Protein of unknown function DUF72
MVTKVRVRAFADGVLNSREITHNRNLVGVEAKAERVVLDDFLERPPEGFRYAVEVRHRSWLGSDLPEMLRERGSALASPSTLDRFLEIRRGER